MKDTFLKDFTDHDASVWKIQHFAPRRRQKSLSSSHPQQIDVPSHTKHTRKLEEKVGLEERINFFIWENITFFTENHLRNYEKLSKRKIPAGFIIAVAFPCFRTTVAEVP